MTAQTTEEARPMEGDDAFYDAHHVNLIHIIEEARAREKAAKSDAEMPAQILKAYLQERDERELCDEERGLKAYIQDREGWEQDLRGMPVTVLVELQEAGLLRFDNAALDALRKAAPSSTLDEAARYRRKVITSTALFVSKLK